MSEINTNTLSTIKLWIIEDNAAYRSNLGEALNATGRIHCEQDFSSFEEALECLQYTTQKPHLLLVDLSLPGMSGIKGLPRIRAEHPDIRCIVLTGSDKKKDVFDAICAGAAGYLLKNTNMPEIIHSIEDVMEGGASLDPHIASMVLNAFPKSKPKNKKEPNDYALTDREIEVLELLSDGKIIKEISEIMHLSTHTVKFHVANTYKKLNVQSQAGAVAKGIRKGII